MTDFDESGNSIMKPKTLLLLGYGYSAQYLDSLWQRQFPDWQILRSSRRPGLDLVFDLEQPQTWNNLPAVADCIVFFPLKNLEAIQKLYQQFAWPNLTVVGTTGAFLVQEPGQCIDETSALDENHERYQCESWLKKRGARVLYSAGIYGPTKSPLQWLRKGLVKDSPSFVNLVHVEDLAQFLMATHWQGERGQSYIASNGKPETWQQIIARWRSKFAFPEPAKAFKPKPESKQIYPRSLLQLGIQLLHPDLDQSVEEIENRSPG